MAADFPFARTLIAVRSERTLKRANLCSSETRYYLSSHLPGQYTDEQWGHLIRGHWGGVEIRNHWRRDVLMGEDGSRTRNPNALANLALLRNAIFALLAERLPNQPLRQVQEELHSNPSACLKLIAA